LFSPANEKNISSPAILFLLYDALFSEQIDYIVNQFYFSWETAGVGFQNVLILVTLAFSRATKWLWLE
jgi:hypothetical protein